MIQFFDAPVLGIESSCDETSAAVTVGNKVLSNVVSSQADLHRKYGGVIPELASRAHVEAMIPVITEALQTANMKIGDIGAIAVTNRPGLIGALSVGVSASKALAWAHKIPLIGVHHLEGHLLSVFANQDVPPKLPAIALIVSGGHTEVVLVSGIGDYKILVETLDDAAGEAFDKSARLLGLPSASGIEVQRAAIGANPKRYSLPIALPGDDAHFSFSGLKTAVLRLVEREGESLNKNDAAASVQHAIVEALVTKTIRAAQSVGCHSIWVVGGVSANESLRTKMKSACDSIGASLFVPDFQFCTDNAAMIALAGSARLAKGDRSDFDLDCLPNNPL